MTAPALPVRNAPPPPPTNRRFGWTALPPKCPRCDTKLKDFQFTTAGGLRCENSRCASLVYLLVCLPIHCAFIVETTHQELVWLNEQQMTPAEVLAHFGATFG